MLAHYIKVIIWYTVHMPNSVSNGIFTCVDQCNA